MRAAAPLLLHVFASFATGGPQVRFATLANRLGGRFRHVVVAMDGRQEARELLDPALNVRFPQIGVLKGDTPGNLRRFRAALRDIAPDLLVTSNWGSIEWALARVGTGMPHLHMEDGFGPQESARQAPRRVLARCTDTPSHRANSSAVTNRNRATQATTARSRLASSTSQPARRTAPHLPELDPHPDH